MATGKDRIDKWLTQVMLASVCEMRPTEHTLKNAFKLFVHSLSRSQSKMSEGQFRSGFGFMQQKEYFQKFLEHEVRPDKRELNESRPTTLNLGSVSTADGSALVKLGNTTVMCGIKGELTQPKVGKPKDGFLVPNVDLPPLCSPQFKPGPPSELAQSTSVFLNQIFISSKCVDLEDLCIAEGKWVWVLYCDLLCLDFDGNLLDACVLALTAALKNTRLPSVTYDEEVGAPRTCLSKRHPLPVHQAPVATSFVLFNGDIVMTDPTQEEESLASAALTVVTLEDNTMCHFHKPGGSIVSDSQMESCLAHAQKRGRELRTLLDELLNDVIR